MKADLQELMITLGEIKHITGEDYKLFKKFIPRNPKKYWWFQTDDNSDQEGLKIQKSGFISELLEFSKFFLDNKNPIIEPILGSYGVVIFVLGSILVIFWVFRALWWLLLFLFDEDHWFSFLSLPNIIIKLNFIILGLLVIPVFIYTVIYILNKPFYILGQLYTRRKFSNLLELFKEVGKYNKIVQDLYVLDQLKEADNPVQINDRESVIEALIITRDGLVRALKTERILRENPTFNPQNFNLDLTSLQAEKTMVKAIEYAELLDNAVQVGVSVQKEMRKLQKRG
ncbi:hypothetical protein [Crocosphaera sp.]|uniref:hypothetical protein n=1 Tax=Crocosphaera sp. TaxID=2729996 RepID=UPI002615EFF9|nr:hypothetical protein [Crocosphaera sp.]MDJ0580090.1 hypothetical protein [Crocosphaera sp.]